MPASSHYRPRPVHTELGTGFSHAVAPARFPRAVPRYRNQRWAERIGLGELSEDEWVDHFCRFRPLPDNLATPVALPYHGHQFHVYNRELGDGRGFLFGQVEDPVDGRLLDLSSKGSGETPFSRDLDGRLTLKGAVREALASAMLEALGVYSAKTMSIVETGEVLYRGDEGPGPLRSAVLVRLSHGQFRIGSFQRLAFLGDVDLLKRLTDFALRHYLPEADAGAGAAGLFAAATARLSEMVAGWMVAGFAHGVLNTDNFSITGESFDYGPYRFLDRYDRELAPASFDETGLFAFGRQPTETLWALRQLANSLSPLVPVEELVPMLERFVADFPAAVRRKFLARLGIAPGDGMADAALVDAAIEFLASGTVSYDRFFFEGYGGGGELFGPLRDRRPADPGRRSHSYFRRSGPCTLYPADIEAIWAAIAEQDDWRPFHAKLAAIEEMGAALALDPGVPGHRGR